MQCVYKSGCLNHLSSCSVYVCVSELSLWMRLFNSYSNHLSSCLVYPFVCGLSFWVCRMSSCLNHLSSCSLYLSVHLNRISAHLDYWCSNLDCVSVVQLMSVFWVIILGVTLYCCLNHLFSYSASLVVCGLSFWVSRMSSCLNHLSSFFLYLPVRLNHLSACLDYRRSNPDCLSSGSVNVCVSELLFWMWLFSSYSNHLSSF